MKEMQSPVFPLRPAVTVEQICLAVPGWTDVVGSRETRIQSLAALKFADGGSMAFCRFAGEEALPLIKASKAAVLITSETPAPEPGRCFIISPDPRGWFIAATNWLLSERNAGGIDPKARIADGAVIGEQVSVGAYAVIEAGAVVGDHAEIGPHVHLTSAAVVGRRVRIQSHSTIGGTGLAFHEAPDGSRMFFPHLGRAIIGDDASVGTHTTIVRGILENTSIGARSMIGNHVNIGHNCAVGEDCFISSGTVVAGGTRLQDRVIVAAGVSVSSHLKIGVDAIVGIGSVVVKDVPEDGRVFGNPAKPLPTLRKF